MSTGPRDSFIPDFLPEGPNEFSVNDPISFSTIQASNETPPTSAKLPTSGIVSPAPPLLGLDMNSNNNSNNPSASAFKITQLGPVGGSNVVVSRMDQPANIYNAAATRSVQQSQTQQRLTNANGTGKYTSNPPNPSTVPSTTQSTNPNNFGQFYHHPHPHQPHALPHLHQQNLVTKFTNMTVSNAGGKNPLKPTHYTVNSSQTAFLKQQQQQQQPASANQPRTTLKAADLIHILPNLVNTLKRRHSQSGQTGNALAAAVATAAASNAANSGKSAAALVAEQLLNVASTPLTAEDFATSASPTNASSTKRVKIHASSSLHQCEVCGKIYKHRNCLSKHRWEHHDAWEHTKKVCQTKHQQVQLLEAAQVLAEIMLGVQPGQRRHQELSDDGEDGDGEEFVEIESQEGSALPV